MQKLARLQIPKNNFRYCAKHTWWDFQTYAVAPTNGPLVVKGPPVDRMVVPWLRVGFVVAIIKKRAEPCGCKVMLTVPNPQLERDGQQVEGAP